VAKYFTAGNFMKIFTFLCMSSLSLSGLCVATESSELQALLTPISTLEANFSQTVKSEQGRVLQQLSGKVWLKKPAKFRWEVRGKEPRIIVADGKTVWDFDQDLEQVTVQQLTAEQIRAPIFFLTGDVNTLDRDFKIVQLPLKNKTCLSNSNACFQLKPKKGEGSFQWIRIGFKNKTLNEMELLDQLGQYSQFLFSDLKLNGKIVDAKFMFTPPKGADVLENN